MKDIAKNIKSDIRFQSTALLALQEAAEAYAVRVFERSQMCAIHAKRKTLIPRDIFLQRILAGESRFADKPGLNLTEGQKIVETRKAASRGLDHFKMIRYNQDAENQEFYP